MHLFDFFTVCVLKCLLQWLQASDAAAGLPRWSRPRPPPLPLSPLLPASCLSLHQPLLPASPTRRRAQPRFPAASGLRWRHQLAATSPPWLRTSARGTFPHDSGRETRWDLAGGSCWQPPPSSPPDRFCFPVAAGGDGEIRPPSSPPVSSSPSTVSSCSPPTSAPQTFTQAFSQASPSQARMKRELYQDRKLEKYFPRRPKKLFMKPLLGSSLWL